MKSITQKMTHLGLLSAALLILTACSSTPPVGSSRYTYTKGVPGGVIVQTFQITATVNALDLANRSATLVQSDGKIFIVKVSSKVSNFDQVRMGDHVNAILTEKISEQLDERGSNTTGETAAAPASEPEHEVKLVHENTLLIGAITAIDLTARTATAQFEDGTIQTQQIRKDVDINRFKIGEQVRFHVLEVTAIKIERFQ